MRKIQVDSLVPGMRLAKQVLGTNSEVYLNAGVILTSRYIRKLRELGFAFVYVYDALLEDVQVPEVQDVVDEETRRSAIGQLRNLLIDTNASRDKPIAPPKELTQTVYEMVDQIVENPSRMINMSDIRAQDEYLYHHSVNVCVLALTAGAEMGLTRRQLFELGVGALLHDVGKMRIPTQILNKPGRLTKEEFEIIKQHPIWAKHLLRDNPTGASIAAMHHERINGEGYPYGLKLGEISTYAQITGLADVFDALTADRCYRKAHPPHEALELLMATGDYWFEFDIVNSFLATVAAYPIGTLVELNSREIGVVVETPKGFPTLPTVRVFVTAEEGWLPVPYDLSTLEKCRFVVRMLEDEELAFIKKRFF